MRKTALKILFTLGLVTWAVMEGQLDFSLVKEGFRHFNLLLLSFGILTVQAVLMGLRWRILLKTKLSGPLPWREIVKINWIGLFFSSFLPGVVTGDLVKLLYVRDFDPSIDKTFLVMSVVLDRTLGLSGLILLMGFFTLFNFSELILLGPSMMGVLIFDAILFLLALLFLAILFLPSKMTTMLEGLFGKIPFVGKAASKTLGQIWIIGKNKKAVGKALLLSALIQFLHIMAFWIVTSPFYDRPLEFSWAVSLIPLGDIAIALPISPSGIGVGHMAFQTLFEFVGIPNGANLFNLYFIVMVSVNLLGVFPYILAGKKHSLKEAHRFKMQRSAGD